MGRLSAHVTIHVIIFNIDVNTNIETGMPSKYIYQVFNDDEFVKFEKLVNNSIVDLSSVINSFLISLEV